MKINPYQTNDPLKKTTIDKNEDPTEVDDPTGIDKPTNDPEVDEPKDDTDPEDPKPKKPTQDTVKYDVIDFDSGELDDMLDGMNDLEALDKLKELVGKCADSVSKISDFVKKESKTNSKKADAINDLSEEIQKDLAYDGTGKGKNSAYTLDIPTGDDTTKDPEDTTETDDKLSEKQTKLETLSAEFEDSKTTMEQSSKDLDSMNNSLTNIVNKAAEKADVKKAFLGLGGKVPVVLGDIGSSVVSRFTTKLASLLGGSELGNIAEDITNPFGIFGDHDHDKKEKAEKFEDIKSSASSISESISLNTSDLNELKDAGKTTTKVAENTLEKIEEKEKEKEKEKP